MTHEGIKDGGFCSKCRVSLQNESTVAHYRRVHPRALWLRRHDEEHHAKYGDMDGQTCLLTECSIHYRKKT